MGEWALEKHERLRKYIDITSATRRKYVQRSEKSKYVGGSAFIDLFCGPGKGRIRNTSRIIDGSPVVAVKAALASGVPYSEVCLSDSDPQLCNAAVQRVKAVSVEPISYAATGECAAKPFVSKLNPSGLHFAFLDPFNLEGLTFKTISFLSCLKRVDILVHLSVSDLQRNFDNYSKSTHSPLDEVAPGWRTAIDLNQSRHSVRVSYVSHWRNLMKDLGFTHRGVELITGPQNQRLYWLVFLSRSEFANDLWDKIRNISGQGVLGF